MNQNVPQTRLIENFWGWPSQKVNENGWETKSEDQLIRCIVSKIKEFDLKSVVAFMKGVKGNLIECQAIRLKSLLGLG